LQQTYARRQTQKGPPARLKGNLVLKFSRKKRSKSKTKSYVQVPNVSLEKPAQAAKSSLARKKSAKRTRMAWAAALLIVFCVAFAFGAAGSADSQNTSSQAENAAATAEQTSSAVEYTTPAQEYTETSDTTGSSTQNTSSGGASDSQSQASTTAAGASGSLKVRFIDVGQGDCILVTCNGQNMLIDGGQSTESSKVYSILKTLGITHLDYVIGSHPDADHIGATSGALSFATCGTFYCSTTESDTKTFANLTKKVAESGSSITVPKVGDSFYLGNALVTFIGPTQAFDDDNNNSLVCRLDFGSTSFLFTGDMESESEYALLSSGANVSADVIKVAHHGSKSSSTASFLSAVSPKYAVICVGQDNSYGHPTDAVLSRLSAVGAQILRTDQLGTITFVSDGTTLTQTATTGNVTD
jgi:competence protein ComEC